MPLSAPALLTADVAVLPDIPLARHGLTRLPEAHCIAAISDPR